MHAICIAIQKISKLIPREVYWHGIWKDQLGKLDWKNGQYTPKSPGNQYGSISYKYIYVDIDNNGIEDVVVIRTSMLRSVDFDFMYIFAPATFQLAQSKSELEMSELNSIRHPSNRVMFSNGQYGMPVDFHL